MSAMDGLPYAPGATADVCLVLEGTWPYVRGGVSSWVAQLIDRLPHVSFSVIFLGARAGEHEAPRYPIPANVLHIEVHHLLGGAADDEPGPARNVSPRGGGRGGGRGVGHTRDRESHERFARSAARHDALREGPLHLPGELAADLTALSGGEQALCAHDLQTHPLAWQSIRERYADAPPGLDFNHYFWSVRSMHEPLFLLGRIAANAPPARVYHAVSTGYAGWLGAMVSQRTGVPYLISEHGIYTKERELDLAQVNWIPEQVDPFRAGLDDGMGYLRELWIRFFHSLGRLSYASADRVFTLYEGNRRRQLADGAPPGKLEIIPNGVDVARFAAVRRPVEAAPPPILLLVGRVVPIKDIKTFIRAMRIVRARLPDAEGWLLGPQDEDPPYTEACQRLVASFGLQDCVRFLGFGKPEEIFPEVGLNVLSSVSEGQPLTVLEGFAAGVPALVTDVGSCRELIDGAGEADRALGCAGAVVPIASPDRFAEAAIALLSDTQAWHKARDAGIRRVESRYDERDMLARYDTVYRDAIDLGSFVMAGAAQGHASDAPCRKAS